MIAAGKISRCIILLVFVTAFALGQPARQSEVGQAEAVVRSLYQQVVAHQPVDTLDGANKKIFSLYLSKVLLHRIDDARACEADWERQHPDPGLKPPGFGYGLFTGDDASPRIFEIEKTDAANDGSFKVHVGLTSSAPTERPYIWHPVVIVVREDGRFVVEDITYPTYEYEDPSPPLSEYLFAGCDGAHWIGFGGQRDGVKEPEALVRGLYEQVVAHHPVDIPYGTNMKIFAPYMSSTLLHKLDLADDCLADWIRQYPDPNLKPPLYEGGIFSGGEERASPRTFEIEKMESENDGSVRVYVKLTHESAPERPWTWKVAPIVVEENGHLAVDDVIFLKERDGDVDARMTEILAEGCNGPLWVGDPRTSPKQQK